MGVLFLMEACQKCDETFGLMPQSTAHTVRDVHKDIERMSAHLMEHNVVVKVENRILPVFKDPTQSGWKKLTTTYWLKDALARWHSDDDDDEAESHATAMQAIHTGSNLNVPSIMHLGAFHLILQVVCRSGETLKWCNITSKLCSNG